MSPRIFWQPPVDEVIEYAVSRLSVHASVSQGTSRSDPTIAVFYAPPPYRLRSRDGSISGRRTLAATGAIACNGVMTPAPPVGSAAHTSIGDLVLGPPVVVEARTRLRSVATTLGDLGIGVVLVTEDDKLVGVVSERDLMWAIANGALLDDIWAADIMTRDPVLVDPPMLVSEVAALMVASNTRHVLVTGAGLPGVVSIRDVVEYLIS